VHRASTIYWILRIPMLAPGRLDTVKPAQPFNCVLTHAFWNELAPLVNMSSDNISPAIGRSFLYRWLRGRVYSGTGSTTSSAPFMGVLGSGPVRTGTLVLSALLEWLDVRIVPFPVDVVPRVLTILLLTLRFAHNFFQRLGNAECDRLIMLIINASGYYWTSSAAPCHWLHAYHSPWTICSCIRQGGPRG
jgi:hypothetical protein